MDDHDLHSPLIDLTKKRQMPEFVLGALLLVVFVSLTVLQVVRRIGTLNLFGQLSSFINNSMCHK